MLPINSWHKATLSLFKLLIHQPGRTCSNFSAYVMKGLFPFLYEKMGNILNHHFQSYIKPLLIRSSYSPHT